MHTHTHFTHFFPSLPLSLPLTGQVYREPSHSYNLTWTYTHSHPLYPLLPLTGQMCREPSQLQSHLNTCTLTPTLPTSSPPCFSPFPLQIRAHMHHKVVGNFGSEADVLSLYFRRFRFNETYNDNNYNNNNNNNNNNNRIQRRYSRFFTISSQRHKLSPTRTLKWPGRNRVQIMCNTSSGYHMQVSWYVPLGTKGQLSY